MTLDDTLKQEISSCYKKLRNSLGLKNRLSQRQMIAEIAGYLGGISIDSKNKRLSDAQVCVVEAGTGIGKTFAYLLASLIIAKHYKKTLVISTATIALQEQLVNKDLPDFKKHSGIDFNFAVAKGRRNYVCLLRLSQYVQSSNLDQLDMWGNGFLSEQKLSNIQQIEYKKMHKAIFNGDWDGECNHWNSSMAEEVNWKQITTDKYNCLANQCEAYKECIFFKAREKLDKVNVIVANHDLVLADLTLGGGNILPIPEEVIYCFDEGHNLVNKSLQHFLVSSNTSHSKLFFTELVKIVNNSKYASSLLSLQQFIRNNEAIIKSAEDNIVFLEDMLAPLPYSDDNKMRFTIKNFPDNIVNIAKQLYEIFNVIVNKLDEAVSDVNALIRKQKSEYEILYQNISNLLRLGEQHRKLWFMYQRPYNMAAIPSARWVVQKNNKNNDLSYELYAAPIVVADVLNSSLWQRCFAAIITSATLRAVGKFDKIKEQAGLPILSKYCTFPSVFDFNKQGKILIKKDANPRKVDEHTKIIVDSLTKYFITHKGSLVLFSSQRQMNDVYKSLDVEWQKKILLQGKVSKVEIISKHKVQILANKKSIIFGLDSFAEGIDLNGEFCTLLVIAKLPFAPPNDPIKATFAEWLEIQKRNPFNDFTMPEASVKLTQAVGRLIRSEKDEGEIIVFDNRLITMYYGKLLLEHLPPFKKLFI